jgi:hypothetical protein
VAAARFESCARQICSPAAVPRTAPASASAPRAPPERQTARAKSDPTRSFPFPLVLIIAGSVPHGSGVSQGAPREKPAISVVPAKERVKKSGLAPTVTGAGIGTFELETASGVYTELQCGSYILMDADYRRISTATVPDQSVRAEPFRVGDGDEPPDAGPRDRRCRPEGALPRCRSANRLRLAGRDL